MRTTLTLEPDVEVLLQRAMREQGAPFKRVVNDALRRGLRGVAAAPAPFVQQVFDGGVPLVDLTKAGALAAELEDQDLIARLAQRR
ncbi:MAG: antitoxin [Burkholderiaceae bacterium]|jgi:hypothetical protein|nr:hypothetical protein [Burkholderiaceae bacterium]MCP5288011.1 antitoxin [Burkholderiaceae bacterium]